MTYEILKNAPPPAAKSAGRDGKYPFAQMDCGDAFYVPIDAIEPAEATVLRVRGAAGAWSLRNKTLGVRFRVLKVPHPETGADCIGVYARPRAAAA